MSIIVREYESSDLDRVNEILNESFNAKKSDFKGEIKYG